MKSLRDEILLRREKEDGIHQDIFSRKGKQITKTAICTDSRFYCGEGALRSFLRKALVAI